MITPSQNRSGLLAAGNWIIDHVKVIEAWPSQDALVTILSETASNGGSPYNILKDLRRLGAAFPLAAAGLVGEDEDGRSILADCARLRIDTAMLRKTAQVRTSYTDVMTVNGTGRRTFFHHRGANALLNAAQLDVAGSRARIFHLGYLLLLDALDSLDSRGVPCSRSVLAAAKAAGMTTSVDLVSENSDRFAQCVRPVLPVVDVLFANDFEAERLTSIPLRHEGKISRTAVEAAARGIMGEGVQRWVVLHFPEGVYALGAGGESVWQPAVLVRPDSIRGAAGAGDAVAAGVLLGLHEAWPIGQTLRLAVCAAAASLSHPTCSEGVASAESCLELGERLGFHATPEG